MAGSALGAESRTLTVTARVLERCVAPLEAPKGSYRVRDTCSGTDKRPQRPLAAQVRAAGGPHLVLLGGTTVWRVTPARDGAPLTLEF